MKLWDDFTAWIDRELIGNWVRCIDCAVNENRERKIMRGEHEPLTNNERGDIRHFVHQAARQERQTEVRRWARQQGLSVPELSRNRLHPVPDHAIRWQDFPPERDRKR